MIRLTVPSIDEGDLNEVCEVLRSGFLIQGPRVAELERMVADLAGVAEAVAVADGTCALQLALDALGVGSGEPAYSWIATANVVELRGATPRIISSHHREDGTGVPILESGIVFGAGCVVTRSLSAYSVAAGVPARVLQKRESAS